MAPFGPCTARAEGFVSRPPAPPETMMPRAWRAHLVLRRGLRAPGGLVRANPRPQVRPACRRCRARLCLSWGCICACQWRQAAVLRAADSSGGEEEEGEGIAPSPHNHL